VRKVTTHADPLMVRIERCSVIARESVIKFNVVVNKVADRLPRSHPALELAKVRQAKSESF
jgi:hypothetical protein